MQELTLPHSPRNIIFPSKPMSTAPLPDRIFLLYSPTTSAILHVSPTSTTRLSVTDIGTDPFPQPHGATAKAHNGTDTNSPMAEAEGASGLRMGMGGMSLTGLGGYVGLGAKAAVPLGTRTVGGEVLLDRGGG